jgi:chromosome condensin MukBEF ATPase and DNA-binding subunit MukB
MSADATETQTQDASQATLLRIDELISQLERAGEQLRSGELSADAAATVVEDCAALATEASSELERLARAGLSSIDDRSVQQVPGQDSLL